MNQLQILENNKELKKKEKQKKTATLLENSQTINYQSIKIDASKDESSISLMEFSATEYSYCFKCEKAKPPRAHHCRICDRFFFLKLTQILKKGKKKNVDFFFNN
jgi:hypothetical protein